MPISNSVQNMRIVYAFLLQFMCERDASSVRRARSAGERRTRSEECERKCEKCGCGE